MNPSDLTLKWKAWLPYVAVVAVIMIALSAYSGWLTARVAPGLPFKIVKVGDSSIGNFTVVKGEIAPVEWDTRPDNIKMYPNEFISLCPVGQSRPGTNCAILSSGSANAGELNISIPDYIDTGAWNLVLTAIDTKNQVRPEVSSAVTISVIDNTSKVAAEESELAAYFPFDEDVNDVGPNNYKGTVFGQLSAIDGKNGKAYHFDNSSYVSFPATGNLSINTIGNISLQAWIKTTSNAKLAGIVKRGARGATADASQEYALVLRNGQPQIIIGNGSKAIKATGDKTVNDGQWHLLTGVVGDSEIKLYVDDTKVASTARDFQNGLKRSNISQVIGALNGSYFVGDIDEVKIWDQELAEDQIVAAILPSGSPSPAPTVSGSPIATNSPNPSGSPLTSVSPQVSASPAISTSPTLSPGASPNPSVSPLVIPTMQLFNSTLGVNWALLEFQKITASDIECIAVEFNADPCSTTMANTVPSMGSNHGLLPSCTQAQLPSWPVPANCASLPKFPHN